MRRSGVAALVAVLLGMTVGSPALAAQGSATVGAPSVDLVRSTIEGVRLAWSAASGPTVPSSWVVRRTVAGQDHRWELPNTAGYGVTTWDDPDLPAGAEATYRIAAVTGGVEGDPTAEIRARHVLDPGPFTPARRALTLTWDRADATHQSMTLLDTAGNPPIVTPIFDTVGLDDVEYAGGRAYVGLPWPLDDGIHTAGAGAGQVSVLVRAGDAGCQGATGPLVVSHGAPTRSGFWKSLSVDADLTCEDGRRLRVQGRFDTPEGVAALAGAAAPVTLAVAAGGSVSRAVELRNVGDEPVEVGSARVVWTRDADPSGVVTVGSSTCEGRTLLPGEACSVTVTQDRPTATPAWRSYAGRVLVGTDRGEVTAAEVVATGPDELAGPQSPSAQGRPGLTRVDWAAGSVTTRSTFDLLDEAGTVLVQSVSPPLAVPGLAPGAHVLRVRQRTDDGREYVSVPLRAFVPTDWVFVSSGTGVRAYGDTSDADVADGLVVGNTSNSVMQNVSLAASPTRAEQVATETYENRVSWFTTATIVRLWLPDARVASPRYRPDGAVLALQRSATYAGTVLTRAQAVVLRTISTGAVSEVPNSSHYALVDWTPDGTSLLVVPSQGSGLFRMNPATGAVTAVAGAADAVDARVSRQGRVAFTRNTTGTVAEVPLAGGSAKDLGIDGWGREITWDPAGTRLAVGSLGYTKGSTGSLWDLSGTPQKIRDLPSSTSLIWPDPVSSPPTTAVTVPAWTTAAPTLQVTATDPDDAPGGLRTECRLDGSTTWVPCGTSWKPGSLAAGTRTVTSRATDPSGTTSANRTTSWRVDASAPTTTVGALASATLSTSLALRWAVTDTGGSGVASHDVRYRRASTSSGLGAMVYPTALQGTKAVSTTLSVSKGYQYCVSARARDTAGNVGAWSAERCTVVALDDRSLSASSAWYRGTSSSYAFSTYSRSRTAKATLTRTGVSARRIGVVATTCSTCGSVEVLVGGTRVATLSLYSSTTRTKQVTWVTTFTSTKKGTLTLRTTSSKSVYVDGLLVSH